MPRRVHLPSWLGYALKAAIAIAVLVAMFRSGKLRPEAIGSAAHRWPELLLAAGMVMSIILLVAARWRLLLHGQGLHLKAGAVFSLTMIGVMFNAVIPGSVSGDLVKAYYVAREAKGRRAIAVATILMDRIIGLACLAAVASAGVLWNRHMVFANPTLGTLSVLALGACVAGCAGLFVAVAAGTMVLSLAGRLPAHLPLRGMIVQVAEVLAAYRNQGRRLLAAFLMSVPVHLLGCATMLVCLHAVGEAASMPATLVLFAFPLGMLAISIPIAPAGVGVGQAAFYAICNMAVAGSGTAAANAFTVFQAVAIPVYLLGLFPYLAYRRQAAEVPAPAGAGG